MIQAHQFMALFLLLMWLCASSISQQLTYNIPSTKVFFFFWVILKGGNYGGKGKLIFKGGNLFYIFYYKQNYLQF